MRLAAVLLPLALAGLVDIKRSDAGATDHAQGRDGMRDLDEGAQPGSPMSEAGDYLAQLTSVAWTAGEEDVGEALALLPSSAFAVVSLSGFPVGDSEEDRRSAKDLFETRLLGAKRSWAKDLDHFLVVGAAAPLADATLRAEGCKNKKKLHRGDHAFARWHCPEFTYLVVECEVTEYWSAGCKYDRAVEYMMYVEPEEFKGVEWFAIGDDDMAYSNLLLPDYLNHYDSSEVLVLNPSAASEAEQETGEGDVNVHWNKRVMQCNSVIPQRLMGTVVSRGALEATKHAFAARMMEKLCASFDGAHDVVQGLAWWAFGAKFVPMAKQSRDNEDLPDSESGDFPVRVPRPLVLHKLRTAEDFRRLTELERSYFPEPKELGGAQYRGTRNAQDGKEVWELEPDTCSPR